MALEVVPITFAEAAQYVREHHRHHQPPLSAKLCVAVADGETIHGVGIAGRPVARMLDDSWTLEVYRVATDGHRNACSMLYRAIWRAARALGYRRVVTYTLESEGGEPSWRWIPRRRRDVRWIVVAVSKAARGQAPLAGKAEMGSFNRSFAWGHRVIAQTYAAQRELRARRKSNGECVRCSMKLATTRFVACLSCRQNLRDALVRFRARREMEVVK